MPLWVGQTSAVERVRQELSLAVWLGACAPALRRPDVVVAVSPSFAGLLPAMIAARARDVPWKLWLQDILPDGAATTGLIRPGRLLEAAQRFERAAYRSVSRIFVISEAFRRNLLSKGVPDAKISQIYNPSAIAMSPHVAAAPPRGAARLLGNIGHSQGLAQFVDALERDEILTTADAVLRIASHGVAAEEARAEIRSSRVEMLGLLLGEDMERELRCATLGIVTQREDISEFNLPSKLMNCMAHSLPALAVVHPASVCARIVVESSGGWVVDSRHPDRVPHVVREALASSAALAARARAAHALASSHFALARVAERFEHNLLALHA